MTGTTGAAWNDPVKGGELAKSQIDRGADVIYHAAGGTGIGVLQAAADAGKLGIGVDSNQNYLHPGQVLTSMLKRVDNATYDAMMDAAQRQLDLGRPGDGPRGGRRRLRARREQRGADHPRDEGRGRRGPRQDHLGRDRGARLHVRREPARRPERHGGAVAGASGGRPATAAPAIELVGISKSFGAVQANKDIDLAVRRGHHPRHRRRERRRQVDADVDPLRLLPGRRRRDPHQRQADARSPTARPRSAPASAWCTSTSCWSSTSPCSRTSSSAPRTARSCARRSPRRGPS